MFPRLVKLVNKLIPAKVSHGWTVYKAVAGFAALSLVMALVPLPQDLPQTNADAFVVMTTVDSTDGDPGDGDCDPDNNGDETDCTLRAAIMEANALAGPDVITFDPGTFTTGVGDIQTISIGSPLIISTVDDMGTTITGPLGNDELHVEIVASSWDASPQLACTKDAGAPLVHIGSAGNLVENLILHSSVGNAIQIVDNDDNTIRNNWIGTRDRDTTTPEGNSEYGVCVKAATEEVSGTEISGNIIVFSGMDGIRLEGNYIADGTRYTVSDTLIRNNLIGNLTGTDVSDQSSYLPGNIGSGITLRNADFNTVRRNIITNNGMIVSEVVIGEVGDGVTLLEANQNRISENYIGTTQLDFDNRGVDDTFPLPTDGDSDLDIASVHPGQATDYTAAPNHCDGIAIRFYDHVDAQLAFNDEFNEPETTCPDEDTYLLANPQSSTETYFDATDLGPSVKNFVYNNDIGSNLRNGIFVQSVACFQEQPAPTHINVPNALNEGAGNTPIHAAQSIQNHFLQNSIFFNDNEQPNTLVTGSGSYGIGIDLEDFATASLELLDLDTNSGSYWGHFVDSPFLNGQNRCSDHEIMQPEQPESNDLDYNITENDEGDVADATTNLNVGNDPDAGANRLLNFPLIDLDNSTSDVITGTGAEGTLIELFQVICTSGTSDPQDIVPTTNADIRTDCDTDIWRPGLLETDVDHYTGHGQGFRFLGNAYVPLNADGDEEGTWSISPSDFNPGGDNFFDVAPFHGGLLTATATAIENLCWDNGSPGMGGCQSGDEVFPAASDITAQRAGSTGNGGLWVPPLPDICTTLTGQQEPTYFDPLIDADDDCFGSTSEFSPVAFVAADLYTLEKTSNPSGGLVSTGDPVDYTITLTNIGSTTLTIDTALDDVYPTGSLTIAGCSWSKSFPPVGPIACVPGVANPDNPIDTTDFGTLLPGSVLTINISGNVKDNLEGLACKFDNTVTASGALITGDNGPATESGTTLLDHTSPTLTASECEGQTGTGGTLVKLVRVNGFPYSDGDAASPAGIERGDPITYLIHFTNSSGTGTGVFLTDTFPATGLSGAATYECWINGSTADEDPAGDTPFPCSYDTVSQAFDSTPGGAIDPFVLADGETLHVRVSGYSLATNYPLAGADLCNVAEIHVPLIDSEPEAFSDEACLRVLDPNLVIYKSVLTPTSNPPGESSGNPGPQVPVNDPVTYYIDVANTGIGDLTGLALTDSFPAGLGGVPAWTCEFFVEVGTTEVNHAAEIYPPAPPCTVNTVTGVITGVPTTIAPNNVLRIRLSGKAIPDSPGSTLCNVIRADANMFSNVNSQACVQVIGPNLDITKSASPTNPAPGGLVTYTITVSNSGTLPALGVTIVDDLDDNSSLTDLIPTCVNSIADVTPQDGGITGAGNTVTWNVGNLAPGASATVHMNVTLRADLLISSSCRNVAVASGSNVTSVNDDADISIQAAVDFEKEVTNDSGGSDDPEIFGLGDTVNYRLTIDNNTPSNIGNLTVRDSIPDEEEDLRDVAATSGTVDNAELNDDRLEVNSISIAGNGTATVDYDVSVREDNDFPLDNYDLDSNADHEDDDFYPEELDDDDVESSDHDDADDALGAPDGNYVSLGEDGEITVETANGSHRKLIVDGDGDDFCILELDTTGQDSDGANEEYEVEVSQTGSNSDFTSVGSSDGDSNCFDLADADDDITWARFVRITDTSNNTSGNAPGSDIDAVCLLNLGGFVTNTASLFSGATLLGTRDEDILVDFTDAFDDPLESDDCRRETITLCPPVSCHPVPPQALPPLVFPPTPFTGLPTTGPESTALPLVSSLVLGMVGWMVKRRKK